MHYKLLSVRDSRWASVTTSLVSFTLCVRMMSAPLITATTSAASEPDSRSAGSFLFI